MKKKLLIACASLCALVIALTPNQSAHSSGGGAAPGYTGSPLENNGRTCGTGGGCHGGGVTNEEGWITSDIPDCGYTPGQTYNITVFVTSPGRIKFGFSCSPQFPNAATAGTLISSAGMQINGGGRYITHTSTGTAQNGTNSRTWTFQWIAPAAGSGNLTFYSAMNATNSNGGSSGDEIHKSSLPITENVPLTIQNSGNTTICSSSPVTLTSSISGNNSWTLNGNPFGSTNSVIASASGTYALTNSNGNCIKNAEISIISIPTIFSPVVSTSGNQTVICPGESLDLTATGTSVVWQPGNVSGNSLTVTEAGIYTASVTNACGTGISEPIEITTLTIPISPEITSDANFKLCPNDTIELVALSSDEITWQPGGENTSTISVHVAGTYSATASNLCGTSDFTEVFVNDMTLPAIPIIDADGPLDFCEGNEVVLNVSNFTFDDVVIWQPSNAAAFEITVSETGTYWVQYSNLCGSSTSLEVDVFVESAPETPVISLNGNDLETSVTANLYAWFLNGEEILDEQDSSISPILVGTYSVQAFSDLGCASALSEPFNYNPTSIYQGDEFVLSVYPNPTQGTISVNGKGLKQNERLQIIDISGKIVYDTFVEKGKISTLNLPLNAGLYMILVQNQRKSFVISY